MLEVASLVVAKVQGGDRRLALLQRPTDCLHSLIPELVALHVQLPQRFILLQGVCNHRCPKCPDVVVTAPDRTPSDVHDQHDGVQISFPSACSYRTALFIFTAHTIQCPNAVVITQSTVRSAWVLSPRPTSSFGRALMYLLSAMAQGKPMHHQHTQSRASRIAGMPQRNDQVLMQGSGERERSIEPPKGAKL